MNHFGNMRERAVAERSAINLRHGFRTVAFLLVLLAAPGHAQLRASGEFNNSIATPPRQKRVPRLKTKASDPSASTFRNQH